jgi:hypothetical protein
MNWYKKAQLNYIPAEEAKKVIQKNRAGDERSKREGVIEEYERNWGDMKLIDLPLSILRNDQIEWYNDSTNVERVNSYSKQEIDTPVVFNINQKGNLVLSDGGHRIMAALQRGDKTIKALVPKEFNELV